MVTSKMPETRARSAPARIMSEEARPPNRRPRASTTIDLPLPVSPVREVQAAVEPDAQALNDGVIFYG